MKTNVAIELNDEQRAKLAQMITGKTTSKLATRKQINDLVQQHIAGLISQCSTFDRTVPSDLIKSVDGDLVKDLTIADDEDAAILFGKPRSFIRGWNQVKRSR